MAAFKVKLKQGLLGCIELTASQADALPADFEMDIRAAVSASADSVLGKDFAIFSGMHVYLETLLSKQPFYIEAGLFGPLNMVDLARLNPRFAPLAKADIDISIDNDEDPFTGGALLQPGDDLPWLDEAEALAHEALEKERVEGPHSPAAQGGGFSLHHKHHGHLPPVSVESAAVSGQPRHQHISQVETKKVTLEEGGRTRYFRPFLTFHVDGHGDEGKRGGKAGRTALAKKHQGLMREAAVFVNALYLKALTKLETEATAQTKARASKLLPR